MYGIVLLSVNLRLIGTFSPRRVPTIATTLTVPKYLRSGTLSVRECEISLDDSYHRNIQLLEDCPLVLMPTFKGLSLFQEEKSNVLDVLSGKVTESDELSIQEPLLVLYHEGCVPLPISQTKPREFLFGLRMPRWGLVIKVIHVNSQLLGGYSETPDPRTGYFLGNHPTIT